MTLILTITAVFLVLLASELWWRYRKPHDELSRKAVHITVGCFAASWYWYLPRWQIIGLAVAFAVVVILSKRLHLFQAIHAVQRPTWGELCFAGAVGVLAAVTNNPAVYAVALLHMGLADGLAALVGTRFGRNNQYRLFGHTKSLAGSAAFLAVSLALLFGFVLYSGGLAVSYSMLLPIALGATLLENISVRGLDNITVPLFVALALLLLG